MRAGGSDNTPRLKTDTEGVTDFPGAGWVGTPIPTSVHP